MMSQKVAAMLARPNPKRIWWFTTKKRMVSSAHPKGQWPAPNEVRCWTYEQDGAGWRDKDPEYPLEQERPQR